MRIRDRSTNARRTYVTITAPLLFTHENITCAGVRSKSESNRLQDRVYWPARRTGYWSININYLMDYQEDDRGPMHILT